MESEQSGDSRYIWLPIDLDSQHNWIAGRWSGEWDFSQFKTGTNVKFESNGGTAVSTVLGLAAGSTITEPAAPTRSGYGFVGWYKDAALTQAWNFTTDTVTAADMTLYAKWNSAQGSTVTYNSNGGSAVSPVTGLNAGSKIAAPDAPTKNGFTFAGWYQDEALTVGWDFDVNTVPSNDFTLYAKWEQVVSVINGVLPVTVATATYTAPVLPANVTVTYNDNSTAQKPVVWNAVHPSQYAAAGSFIVNGAVGGTAIPAVANVTVTDNVYPVQSISVSGAGGMNEITVQGGTLQMQAIVLPSNANDQVTWNVWEADGITMTNKATINAGGLLTAKINGMVKVVATAADGSGVQGFNYVMISGQTPTDAPHATLTGVQRFKQELRSQPISD